MYLDYLSSVCVCLCGFLYGLLGKREMLKDIRAGTTSMRMFRCEK